MRKLAITKLISPVLGLALATFLGGAPALAEGGCDHDPAATHAEIQNFQRGVTVKPAQQVATKARTRGNVSASTQSSGLVE